jgi:histidinol-phosphatase
VRHLADASFSFSDGVGWPPGALAGLTDQVWRARAYGDFWSHLLVAEGAVDLAAEPQLNPWDIAALIPIVEQAGGRITGYDGSPALTAGSGLTSNGLLHPAALAMVAGSSA